MERFPIERFTDPFLDGEQKLSGPVEKEKDWSDPGIFGMYEKFRGIYRELNRNIVGDIVGRHIIPGTRILEVGSGAGELSDLLPAEYKTGLIQTERTELYAHMNRDRRGATAVADVYALPFPDAAVDSAMGFAMLDVLADPKRAADEIRRVLRPDGKFVHFLDLGPNLDVMFADIIAQGRVPFMRRRYNLHSESHQEKKIEDWTYYSSCSTADLAETQLMLELLQRRNSPYADLAKTYTENPYKTYMDFAGIGEEELILDMSSELNRSGLVLRMFDPVSYFTDKMRKVFTDAGFVVESDGLERAEMDLPRLDGRVNGFMKSNIVVNRMGEMLSAEIEGIPEGMVRLREEVHALVVRKLQSGV